MQTYENHFERAIYALHPATKSVYRAPSCTWQDDPRISVTLDESWIVVMEDTSLHSHDWDDGGELRTLVNQHGVDNSWRSVSRRQAEAIRAAHVTT